MIWTGDQCQTEGSVFVVMYALGVGVATFLATFSNHLPRPLQLHQEYV